MNQHESTHVDDSFILFSVLFQRTSSKHNHKHQYHNGASTLESNLNKIELRVDAIEQCQGANTAAVPCSRRDHNNVCKSEYRQA